MSARHEMSANLNWQEMAFEAVRKDDFDVLVSALAKGIAVDQTDAEGDSLLKIACEGGGLSIARALLERGADTEGRDRFDRTPLAVAASNGNLRMVRLLVGYGADVTADQGGGRLPVDFAAKSGHLETVKYLESVSKSGKAGRMLFFCHLVRASRGLAGRLKGFHFVPGT